MRIENVTEIELGDTVRFYDGNDIKLVEIIGLNSWVGDCDNYTYLCVDLQTHEVVTSFTEDTFKDFKFKHRDNFDIEYEINKCITNIKLKYPNDTIKFNSYESDGYLEVYRVHSNLISEKLCIDNLTKYDIERIKRIEKKLKSHNKLSMWTITVIKNDGEQYMIECENEDEVKCELQSLKEGGQDMEYVTVFPPKTGFIATNFITE